MGLVITAWKNKPGFPDNRQANRGTTQQKLSLSISIPRGAKDMRGMTAITIVTGFFTAAAMFIVMTHFAAICIDLVASCTNSRVIAGKIRLFLSNSFRGMCSMTGITFDHGMSHF